MAGLHIDGRVRWHNEITVATHHRPLGLTSGRLRILLQVGEEVAASSDIYELLAATAGELCGWNSSMRRIKRHRICYIANAWRIGATVHLTNHVGSNHPKAIGGACEQLAPMQGSLAVQFFCLYFCLTLTIVRYSFYVFQIP